MRDNSDMMDDAMSEDNVMDYGGNNDNNTNDLINLATDISNSSSTIQDAAERLLTLLGVEDSDEEFLSSEEEDEGVEIDLEDCENNEKKYENIRLLHQLANSLAQELRYSQSKNFLLKHTSARCAQTIDYSSIQCMELGQDQTYLQTDNQHNSISKKLDNPVNYLSPNEIPSIDECESQQKRLKINDKMIDNFSKNKPTLELSSCISSSWDSGWIACAHEAIRYLIEKEGLEPHHPTILALKNHLFMQRDNALTYYLT